MRTQREQWDTYIELAQRYGWTQQQVDALDPDYVEELRILIKAEADQRKWQRQQKSQKGEGADVED